MKHGRNDPCLCGSGKKYKNCCLGKIESRPLEPSSAELNQLAALSNAGRHIEVEIRAGSLLKLFPNAGAVWKLLSVALHMQGKDPLFALQQAVYLLPDDAKAHNNLGNALHDLGQFDNAVAEFRRAVELNPKLAEVYHNLGIALNSLGKLNEAATNYRHALKIKPDYADAHNNLGITLNHLGQLNDALASYRKALEFTPDHINAQNNLLYTLTYATSYDPAYYLAESIKYGRMAAKKVATRFTAWQCAARPARLRVGLVSGDFRSHSAGHFLEAILTKIDPLSIELIAYPTYNKQDALTARIRPYFLAMKPLFGKSDEAAARLIHADGVHVLLDLSGHSKHNRLPLFSWKPAPVQVSWLGYWATTGVAEVDYFLADEAGVPETQRQYFTESVWYLPDTRLCFTPPAVDLPVAALPALQNGYITFGCFQSLAKVPDEVLAVWSNILTALPDARLRWQCSQLSDPALVAQFVERLQQYGIDPARVAMHGAVAREVYLAAHAEVDMILDTFPYPGGTTTCEALWMGVPTLTLAGDSLLARQGASLLAAAGMPEWVVTNREDYVAKAIALASNIPMLATRRLGLRQQVLDSPLFDAARFARNFEDALWGMWQAWDDKQQDEKPDK